MLIHNDIASPSLIRSRPLPSNISKIRVEVGNKSVAVSGAYIKYPSTSINFGADEFVDKS
jgi:hypothetical protein